MFKKLTLMSLLICGAEALRAQDISSGNFQWTVVNAKSQNDSTAFSYSCVIKTNAGNSLDWIQNGGQMTSHFNIISVSGTWTDISQDGQIIYQVQSEKISGTVQFQRSSGVLQIHLQLAVNGRPDQDYIFSVSSIALVN